MGSLYPHYEEENYSSNTANLLNPEEFRRQGHMIIDFIADYYQNMEKYPVLSQVQPDYLAQLLPKSAPNIPEPIETILHDIQQYIIPGITHWQSPNYFAYFPSSGSIAGFLGEVLSTGFNVVGFNWISSPAATELEFVTMDWLGQMLGLPQSFLFSGTGGVAARDQMLAKVGRENMGKLVIYGSDQTHSKVAGLECKNFRAIKTMRSTAFQLSAESLRTTIRLDVEAGLIPAFLCATIGTTSTTAVDPIRSLSEVTKEYGMWIHVDAAYAGSACICPEYRHFIDGAENVNSFSFNAHKWFFTTLDCCCLWVKDPGALTKSLSASAEFLKNNASDSKQVVDYKDWQITLSRRFRSMKLWLVLRSYGVENLRNFLRSHVKMAKLVVPRNFAMVCFRVLPTTLKKEPNGCKKTVNASGKIFMTHTIVEGIYVIRFAVGATLTEDKHVIKAWKVVQETVGGMLATI
ncbi:hypothetical protein ES332_D10G228400v1 [Gossypium tomentosum]|uniref:Tyrosine decarboxylase n=1 Tax=Gossypium tomentosum TaxID=34277 RepID=A0A5D2J858_GOSTO|nr:hypothetical protein ES332_D10G228400v1 [Gossypium tomentosum]